MSTSTAALDEIRDLCGFINHHNAQVRLQACKMVTSLSALEDNRHLIAQTDMVTHLAKQMTDVKEISREVYKALINLAESEEVYQKMLKANLISIAMECLRDSSTDLEMRELILMFLVNMSRDEKGASLLMQEGEEVEGLHVRRLLNWFTQPSASTSSNANAASASPAAKAQQPVMDPNAYCAHILTNVSQIAPGRRLLMHADRGYLAQLKPQLLSTNSIRRMGSFQLFKNCFIEESHHAALLDRNLGLMPLILRPILGPEPFLHGESEYEGIDPRVRDQLTPEKRRDSDPHLRVIVYEILLLCAKVKPSRVLLKSQAIYPILRHAHDAEKADSDPAAAELDDMLEQLVPFFILDEDDALHPDQIEAEKRRARVDQLKAMNDLEEEKKLHPNETPEQRKERLKAEAERADKAVHYLGDELGGEVRRKEEMEKRAASAAAAAASPAGVAARANASSVAPPRPGAATIELIDDTFPDIEPLGAAETLQLGEVAHNIQSLETAKAALHAAPAPAKPEVVYAQASSEWKDEEDDDEEDEDAPPPLADEEDRYMNGLD